MILGQERLRTLAEDPAAHFWKDVTLYVTIEPCVMCASALRQIGKQILHITRRSTTLLVHEDYTILLRTQPGKKTNPRGYSMML